jgi:hypothetical protein
MDEPQPTMYDKHMAGLDRETRTLIERFDRGERLSSDEFNRVWLAYPVSLLKEIEAK